MTAPVSNNTPLGASPYSATGPAKGLVDETQNRFLTLLVTQLKNQDPMNPMDNAQVTTQIAQLSTVNGINQLNNTLLALSGQLDVGQSMQAASLIGKSVLVPGGKISLGTDPNDPEARIATPFGVDLVSSVSKLVVSVLDDSGKAVRQIEMGEQKAGVLTLDWDGKDDAGLPLPNGKYSFKVAAMNQDGEPIPADTLTYGKVDSVAYTSSGLRLEMGLAGSVSLLDVRKIM